MVSSYFTNFLLLALLVTLSKASPILRRSRQIPHNFLTGPGAGTRCTTSFSCEKGMICNGRFLHSVCISIPENDSRPCNFFASKCGYGRVCAGTLWTRRCVKPMEEGVSCGNDPFLVCKEGLNCRSNVCLKPLVAVGRSCLAQGTECVEEAVCAGPKTSRRCVKPMEEGENCGRDPFWVCGNGLKCRNGICRKPFVEINGFCLEKGSECVTGAICVGTKTSKRCVKPMKEGENCGSDPFWVCEEGLNCRNNICRKPFVKIGGSCLPQGSECELGSVCAGTSTSKRCVKPMKEGENCGSDPFWVCEEGLNCRNNICRKPVVKVGGSCLPQGSECELGSVCAGTSTSKRCVKPMKEGENCGSDPFWVCENGLTCRNSVCRKPLVKVGGSCLGQGFECEEGLICAGTKTSKRCVTPMDEGKSCGRDPFWICKNGLSCMHNVCRKPFLKTGSLCSSRGLKCEEGAVCAGTNSFKRCVKPMKEGGSCGRSPFWVCDNGLSCRNNICRKPLVKLHGSCLKQGSECEKGLACAGTKISKRCVKPMKEGENCGRDPFWICEKALNCKNSICRKPAVKVGESCLVQGSECEEGAICAGTRFFKRCVNPMKEGENCGSDPLWVCASNLSCHRNICRKY